MTRTTSRGRARLTVSAFSIAAFAIMLFAGAAHARADRLDRELRFEIPAQPLATALVQFSRQAELQLVTSSVELGTRETRGVSGRLSIRRALESLLDQTGLAYSLVGENTVAISAASDPKLPGQTAGGLEGLSTQSLLSSENHLAQVEPSAESASRARNQDKEVSQANNKQDESRPTKKESRVELGEIVVTGTHIRARAPVGSEIIVIDRAEIERSGYGTVHDVIGSLPQNYGGGVGEEFSDGREGFTNTTDGNSPNLRGLGSGATLVLVNGRRIAPTGNEGIYNDLSNIPLSAVERIEVLLDGASAIYGSAAVGGVVNVILRQDYRGAETRLRAGTVTEGDAQEYQFAQSLGAGWETGHGLLSYEFYKREALGREDRELSSNCDLQRFGGDNFCNIFSNPGNIFAGDQIWAIPAGQDGRSLSPADFVAGAINLENGNEGASLLPRQERQSISAFVSQSVGERLTLEGSALFSSRDATSSAHGESEFLFVTSDHPFYVNPAGGTDPIFVAYNLRDDLGSETTDTDIESYLGTLTAKFEVSETWQVSADVGYSRDKHERAVAGLVNDNAMILALADPDPATVFNPFGDGSHTDPSTLDAVGGDGMSSGDSDLWTIRLAAEGPVLQLPAGDVRLAFGAEYDQQEFSGAGRAATGEVSATHYEREVSAGYVELLLPLMGRGDRGSAANRLELSLAGRYEEYGDFGDTLNPKFGVKWSPVDGFALRGSWGTSFKAPNVFDLDESQNLSFIFPIADPDSPSGFANSLIWTGGNADLTEETATTWNVGIDIAPPSVPGLNIKVSYFDIDFEDRIELVFFDPFATLQDPAIADLVTRNPTPAQREMACSRSTFLGDPNDCLNAPIDALVDTRIGNSAIVRNSGIDFLGSYAFESDIGTFNLGLNATYLIEFARALRETSALLEILDTPFNPLEFRLRGSVSWARGGFETIAYVNYADSYVDTVSEPDRKIDSWTTLDLALSYSLPLRDSSLLSDTLFSLNVQNLFDEDPPFYNNPAGVGYDAVNASLLGRFVSFQVRMGWGGGQAR